MKLSGDLYEKTPKKANTYNTEMKKLLDDGKIEEITGPTKDDENMDRNIYYLPHSCVVKEERVTTKVRMVFDASAKNSEGQSLNDQLLEGPKLQLDIVALLLKLRMKKIVLVSDVSKMFHQILIQEPYRDYYRFLWNFDMEAEEPKIYRFKFLLMGSKDSPYLALATIHHHLELYEKQHPEKAWVTKLIREHLYVDDLIVSVDTVAEAIMLRKEISSIFGEIHMEIKKWASNSEEVLQTIPEKDLYPYEQKGTESNNLTFLDSTIISKDTKCLGMCWSPKEDTLHYKSYDKLSETKNPPKTKRGISSIVPSIYDPLGILQPYIIEGKMLLQSAWCYVGEDEKGLDWDDPLPREIENDFQSWLGKLKMASKLQMFRYLFHELTEPPNPENLFLHVFPTLRSKPME